MSIKITAREYLKDISWSLKSRARIDSVSVTPYTRTVASDVIHTQEITSGMTLSGNQVTLPIADNFSGGSTYHEMYNNYFNGTVSKRIGFGYTDIIVIKGSYIAHLTEPPADTPVASYTIAGKTTYVARGKYSVDDIENAKSTICTFIETNQVGNSEMSDNKSYDTYNRGALRDGLLIDYQGTIPLYPWIRKAVGSVPLGMSVYSDAYKNSPYDPLWEDIFCDWMPSKPLGIEVGPALKDWNTYTYDNTTLQGPSTGSGHFVATADDPIIPLPNSWLFQPSISVRAINSYDYEVSYTLPIRYVQAAAAKNIRLGVLDGGQDSYAWKDVVSKITIQLYAPSYTTATETVEVTRDGAKKYPITFDNNELINVNTVWSDGYKWVATVPDYLMRKYYNGKYIVECNVKAEWAIQNGITINSEITVQLLDGSMIRRNNKIVTFQVKSIEKRFRDSQFIYNLKLLEV